MDGSPPSCLCACRAVASKVTAAEREIEGLAAGCCHQLNSKGTQEAPQCAQEEEQVSTHIAFNLCSRSCSCTLLTSRQPLSSRIPNVYVLWPVLFLSKVKPNKTNQQKWWPVLTQGQKQESYCISFWGCCNKIPPTGWFKTEMYSPAAQPAETSALLQLQYR